MINDFLLKSNNLRQERRLMSRDQRAKTRLSIGKGLEKMHPEQVRGDHVSFASAT